MKTKEELVTEILKSEAERTERIYLKRTNDKLTYEEIGKQENISRERVRQICNRVERKIEYTLRYNEREKHQVKIIQEIQVAIDLANGNRIYGLKGKCPFCGEEVYHNWYGPVGIERPDNIFCHKCGQYLEWKRET